MKLKLLFLISLVLPLGLWSQNPDVFVCSEGTNSVKRYDGNTGQFLGDFVTPGLGQINTPREVLFHPNGHLLVTGRFSNAIKMYDAQTGAFIKNFTQNYPLDNAGKATWGPDGYLYVSQWGITKSRLVRFDSTGAFVDEFNDANLNQACGHTWDDDGNLYVAVYGEGDEGNVLIFDTLGNAPQIYLPNGFLQGPVNVWFRGGDFYVADHTLGQVIQYDPSNKMQLGVPVLGLSNVEGYAYDPAGKLYVCEPGADQVRRYDIPNNVNGVFISDGGLDKPNSIAFRPGGTTSSENLLAEQNRDLILNLEQTAEELIFHLELSKNLPVRVQVFDISGREVASSDMGILPQGKHDITLPVESFSKGAYFYKVSSKEAGLAGKIIIR